MAHVRENQLPAISAWDEPVQVLPITRNGQIIDWHVVRNEPIDESVLSESIKETLALAGAWSDLDGDEMLDALDRLRHESTPTPPIDDL